MNREVFTSLVVDAVGHACFEPMVPVYQKAARGSGNQTAQEIRAEFYRSLTEGQRALFLFFSFYDHAIQSVGEFQRMSGYYLTAGIFGAVKKAAAYFRDDAMLALLSETEGALLAQNQDRIMELYHMLREISPRTLGAIGVCVKGNPSEYVSF